MPIPDKPLTRGEVFLNAVATGDASNLPDPKTREEMYLEAIAQGGGGGGALVVHVTATTSGNSTIYTCDKTAAEMYAAMQTGVVVIAPYAEDTVTFGGPCSVSLSSLGEYKFGIAPPENNMVVFTTETESDYPSYSKGLK